MSWQMRHEGSPHVTAGLTPNQIISGLNEGVWEPSDEVRGPADKAWIALESHPFFEEALADYEPNKRHHDDLEEHLDMNPLIDVALVLLIFFILTTSYDALKKVMDMPTMSKKDGKVRQVPAEVAKQEFVHVEANLTTEKKIVYKVDDREVMEDQLETAISIAVSEKRDKMIIDVNDATWDSVIRIIDAGKRARVQRFMMRVKE